MKTIVKIAAFACVMALSACGNKIEIPVIDDGKDTDPPVTPSAPSKNMVKYRPHNYSMWDNWTIVKGDSVHLFHLQYTIWNVTYANNQDKRGFGHAASGNMLTWNERREVLHLYNTTYNNDWDFRYTGSTIEHNGTYYMYYTMRKWGMQRIGLATSTDLYNWNVFGGNPVLEPDPAHFISFNAAGTGSNHPLWGDIVDCRDMLVIKNETGTGFYGYFVAAADRPEYGTPTSVIGMARSTDLIHWTDQKIVYKPAGVCMPEMIDVFEIGGKWYMTLTTGKNNGSLVNFSDPYISRAMIYAVSAVPDGMFTEDFSDNVVLGGSINSGFSMRSVVYKGKRRIMYADVNNGLGVLSLPKDVRVNSDGRLRLYYASDILETLRTRAITPEVHSQPNNTFGWWPSQGGVWKKEGAKFNCVTKDGSWQAVLFKGVVDNAELNFTVKASTCDSYGFMLCTNGENPGLNEMEHIMVIEPSRDRIYLSDNVWDVKNLRSYAFDPSAEYRFKMILMGNTIELYINEELVFNSGLSNSGGYLTGLFANSGTLEIADVSIFELMR